MSVPARMALCLAVLLAGCSGTEPGVRTDTTPRTVTPAPVPTDEGPTVREGIDGERLVPLTERHEAALAGRSFTALGRRVVTGPVGVLLDLRWEHRVAADRDTYHAIRSGTATWGWDGPDPVDRRHHYHAGNRTLTRYETGGETRYEVETDASGGPLADRDGSDIDGADYLGELFRAFGTWRVVSHPNGSLTLSGRDLDRPEVVGATAPITDPRNATVEVWVEPGGVVTRVAVRFEATVDGRPASVVEVRRFVAVETTATDPPPWYGVALGTPAANATAG